ncbi:ACP phosphodiesterase [Salinicola sp. JS01]|uniref:acyl carrier protein phosphodiesterase n=1 Tax=Salinicola sp. JS01 TaxID=3050071 RepID=UPI00255B7756|nr:ACP phosphodiesterase [Salinicola sp. JS01]WIX34697.1 ACP phosphodiesterase [Salinicola sp. JS01]
MNFLAHAELARHGSDDFLLGNLIADGVKGQQLAAWPAAVAAGIRHHRQVDAAIDCHPEVVALRASAPAAQRRFVGIALDLVWDHFLAACHPDRQLVIRCYRVLGSTPAPDRLGRLVPAMIEGDWLARYADFAFTCRAIAGIGSRLRGPNRLAELTPWLDDEYPRLESAFARLWPDMRARFAG